MKTRTQQAQLTSDRIQVWRQTYGPGQRPSGARVRDEVTVCTVCSHVAVSSACPGSHCHQTDPRKLVRRMDVMDPAVLRQHGRKLSGAYLQRRVPSPCSGLRISPAVEAGCFWL